MKINTAIPATPAKPKPDYKGNRAFWKATKAEYLAKNLDPDREKDWSYKDVALHYSIPYETVADQAKRHRWGPTLRECQAELEIHANEKMVKALAISEADIRIRQQKAAERLIKKAMAGIEHLDPSKMEAKDLLNMARLGLTQERAAVGLADRIDFQDLSQPSHEDHDSPLAKMEEARKKNALADRLMKALDTDAEEEDDKAKAE